MWAYRALVAVMLHPMTQVPGAHAPWASVLHVDAAMPLIPV